MFVPCSTNSHYEALYFSSFIRCTIEKKYILLSVEMATLTRKDNKTIIRVLTSSEVEKLISDFEKSEADAEAAKKQPPKS